MYLDWAVAGIFLAVYLGMALGRWPGLAVDRTGVALIGAVLLFAAGAVDGGFIVDAIDFPTLAVLFGLMVLSAQLAASGLFDWCGTRLAAATLTPNRLLLAVIFVAGGLSAVLTNDVVVWALVPVLIRGVRARGLDPRPYVIALACAANAGSAATLIGNPQNLLIGQVGGLAFWPFAAVCGPPAALALVIVHGVIAWRWRHRLRPHAGVSDLPAPTLDRPALTKGALAAAGIFAIFTFPVSHATWVLVIAAFLLLSRRLSTRYMLSMVDWHLLLLFASLFVVTAAMARLPEVADLLGGGARFPFELPAHAALAGVTILGSNSIGNVPLVTLLLSLGLDLSTSGLYALALFSTLSGNLLIVGSMANIIAIQRAGESGLGIGFAEHARVGIPVTLASLAVSYLWLAFLSASVV